ncbi:GNAT family N-acetyltransferase [Dactylosporangium cerinum]|uniref:GNAT family N-acetyltransferase n=1 Tax=Dactylosporangium cerinum TaxID=1434730 RepID=A0ABV9W787_9ACTN
MNPLSAVDPAPTGVPRPVSAWSVEVRRDDTALAEIRTEWNDLFRRCATATPFQAHAWIASWWHTYGRPGRLRLILVRLDGRLVAAAALLRQRRWLCSVLTPVGGDLSDFADVLVDEALAEPAARALADALAQVSGWQVVDLPETRPGSVAGTLLAEAWRGRHHLVPASLCLELPARDLDDLVADLPGHTRKTVRRRVNQLRRLGLDVRAVTADEAGRAVGDLLALHARQWQGRQVNPEHVRAEFARHLGAATREMIADGQAELFEYRLDGQLVASSLAVVGRDLVGGYLYGAEPDLRDRADITTLLLSDTLPLAVRRSCATMSMLRGAEPYKLRWRPVESVNQRVLLVRGGSPRARLYAAGVRTRRAAVLLAKRHLPGLRALRDRLRRRPGGG